MKNVKTSARVIAIILAAITAVGIIVPALIY